MEDINFKGLLQKQRQFFATGKTKSLDFRLEQLKKLNSILKKHEAEIADALKKDLHKPETESIFHELLCTTKEISYIIKHLKSWARPQKVSTPFPIFWPGRSEIHYDPYGSVLIVGPWNYPFLLVMSPLVGAMCAGNCAVVKPSEVAPHTQDLILKIINNNFPPEYITAIKANAGQTQQLLQEKFDYIFFTGGTKIGKIFMEAAAKHLTPCTLELGGKSPCIVDETSDLDFAARRIAWSKFANAGQTCIAPDYLYVHESCKSTLIEKLKNVIQKFYGENPEDSNSYARIIDKNHFARLVTLMQNTKTVFGGKSKEDKLYISPTLVDDVSWTDQIMQEEIFGPILPILTFKNLDEVISTINQRPKPLALYLFTKKSQTEKRIMKEISFGNGCVNDCLVQIANLNLPFGGVGMSGLGKYHGKYSFETFSHSKSVYKKTIQFDYGLEYPPYSKDKLKWIKRVFNWSWE